MKFSAPYLSLHLLHLSVRNTLQNHVHLRELLLRDHHRCPENVNARYCWSAARSAWNEDVMFRRFAYLFQSSTSEKGRMYESAMMTGTQPACSTSLRAAWPRRAPRNTTQNDDSCDRENAESQYTPGTPILLITAHTVEQTMSRASWVKKTP